MEEKTIIETVKEFLFNCGMFQNQVDEVVERVMKDEIMIKTLDGRWNDRPSDYGPAGGPLMAVILGSIKPIALAYIDEKCPKAWFRPMFLSAEEQRKILNL